MKAAIKTNTMRISELKEIKEKLAEKTNVDINMIEVSATQKIYDKYELPALFIDGDGDFNQGDATDKDIFEAARNINRISAEPKIYVFYNEGCEDEDVEIELNAEELYSFLKMEYWRNYAIELLKAVKANWKDLYEDEIREFLNKNFYESGEPINVDYSIFIDIETGHMWEDIHTSSNWSFPNENENRKRILHLDSYEKPFNDFTDFVSEVNCSKKSIDEQFGCELPEELEDDFDGIIEWLEENANDEIKGFNEIAREEAIDKIIENIED